MSGGDMAEFFFPLFLLDIFETKELKKKDEEEKISSTAAAAAAIWQSRLRELLKWA
jgi:hypothetical protein